MPGGNRVLHKVFAYPNSELKREDSALAYHIKLIGDGRYGGDIAPNPINRLGLHAFKLCFYHPVTNELMQFETPYPMEFRRLLFKPQK
jgi:hypothetical protein